jgi:Fic family protein
MLFATPELDEAELRVIGEVDGLKETLRLYLHEPHRWFGSLRRVSMARAVQGSNSIEGYEAALDDAAAIDLGEEPLDADQETTLALKGYRDAMTYVLTLANEASFEYSEQLLKSLHFMMTGYDLKNRPGQWLLGSIYVRNEASGEIVYEGADIDEISGLMSELVTTLNTERNVPTMVRAGMAHLNLVMVHPFRDGNGRMARCLQTLVVARDGVLSPVFCSIEEYLGRNTQSYYDLLALVGGGHWQPEGDARPWVRYILTAQLRQARTMLRRVKESERLWGELELLINTHGLPDRVIGAMFDASMAFRVRNATYRAIADDEITEATATRDLKQLVEASFFEANGEKRGRFYTATPMLRAVRRKIVEARDPRDDSDPFANSPLSAEPIAQSQLAAQSPTSPQPRVSEPAPFPL